MSGLDGVWLERVAKAIALCECEQLAQQHHTAMIRTDVIKNALLPHVVFEVDDSVYTDDQFYPEIYADWLSALSRGIQIFKW